MIAKYAPTALSLASNMSASLNEYAPELIRACSSISTSVNSAADFAEANIPAIEKSLAMASEALATIADMPNTALASNMDRSVTIAASSLRGLSDFAVVVQVNIKTIAFGAVIVIATGIVLGLFLSNYIFTLNLKQNLIYLGIKWLIWLVKLLWTRCHRNKEEKKEVWAREKEVIGTKTAPRVCGVGTDDVERGGGGGAPGSPAKKSTNHEMTILDDSTAVGRSRSSDEDYILRSEEGDLEGKDGDDEDVESDTASLHEVKKPLQMLKRHHIGGPIPTAKL
jgi:hypothetical protein